MSPLRLIYLLLAIVGAVVPMWHFIGWFRLNGWDLSALTRTWFVHPGVEGLAWDLTIAAATLTVWILAETWARRNWSALVAIPATFCIGVSCGLPLYLFLRTRPVH